MEETVLLPYFLFLVSVPGLALVFALVLLAISALSHRLCCLLIAKFASAARLGLAETACGLELCCFFDCSC